MIIDFTTRRRLDADPPASIERVGWNDPDIRESATRAGFVIIDGFVPIDLAERFEAMCADRNRGVPC